MFLVPGKQKPVTMYFVAVKQRFFKCHSRTVNLLKLSWCDSEGLVLDEITRGRTAIHSIFVISGFFCYVGLSRRGKFPLFGLGYWS